MAVGEKETSEKSVKECALCCVENLLVRDEISIDVYEILNKVLDLLGCDSKLDLGEGILLQLVDSNK
jgi:hypothetical protein